MCCDLSNKSRWTNFVGGGFAAALAAGVGIAAFAGAGAAQQQPGQGGHAAQGAQAGQSAQQEKQDVITGELIDTACFVAAEGEAKGKEHAECANKCMATGIPAGILPDGKDAKAYMVLLTNPAPLAQYAAQTIRVEGKAHPDMHAFDAKKVFVKDGQNWKEVQLNDEHHQMGGGAGDGHTDHSH